jgi:hypothetical protein
MVPVAQSAERRTVDAVVEGSNPFGHPQAPHHEALFFLLPFPLQYKPSSITNIFDKCESYTPS